MDCVPTEVLIPILSYLTVLDRHRLKRASRRTKAILEDPRNNLDLKLKINLEFQQTVRGDVAIVTTEQPRTFKVMFNNGNVDLTASNHADSGFFSPYKKKRGHFTNDTLKLLTWLFDKFKITLVIKKLQALNPNLRRHVGFVAKSSFMAIEKIVTSRECFSVIARWFPARLAPFNIDFVVETSWSVLTNQVRDLNRISRKFPSLAVKSSFPIDNQLWFFAMDFKIYQVIDNISFEIILINRSHNFIPYDFDRFQFTDQNLRDLRDPNVNEINLELSRVGSTLKIKMRRQGEYAALSFEFHRD